jgi:flagellar biosynthesis repressor protein FlbT
MAGLVLKLARHERILVNGALIENGDRKAELRILTKDAIVLRERLLLS